MFTWLLNKFSKLFAGKPEVLPSVKLDKIPEGYTTVKFSNGDNPKVNIPKKDISQNKTKVDNKTSDELSTPFGSSAILYTSSDDSSSSYSSCSSSSSSSSSCSSSSSD